MHCDKPAKLNETLLGETILSKEVALTVRTFLTEFLTLAKDIAFWLKKWGEGFINWKLINWNKKPKKYF